jgi:hypothetical protein
MHAVTSTSTRRVIGAVLSLFLLASVTACSSGSDAGGRDTRTDTDCTKQQSSGSAAQSASPGQSGSGASGDASSSAAGVPGSGTGTASGTSGQGDGTGDCGGKTGFGTSDDGGAGSGG